MTQPDPGMITFVKVTNQDIYTKLLTLEKKLDYTNGKVKLTRWMAGMALTIALGIGAAVMSGVLS